MSDVLMATASADALFDRPIIGFSPWIYPRPEQWAAQKNVLTWMNAKSLLFHLTPKTFSSEIDRYTNDNQLAGRLPAGPALDPALEALRQAMQWADDVQGASVHFVCARPVAAGGFTGKAYAATCTYEAKPFSVCAWASYLAELMRWLKNDHGVPVHVLHVIDEPRWVYRNDYSWFGLTFDQMWAMWPQGWVGVYVELDRQMRERGCRAGTNLLILSDGGFFFKKDGVAFDDVKWLYDQTKRPEIAAAGDGLGLVYYGDGNRDITQLITDMRQSLAAAGTPNRLIFFKDVGGIREVQPADQTVQPPPFTARQQFDYGLDALGAILRAARMGTDMWGQYFWTRPEPSASDPYPTREFALEWDASIAKFRARFTLHLFALFTRTQDRGAIRLRDTASLPSRASFLALQSPSPSGPYRSYYFVNEGTASIPVDFTPSRTQPLWRYSVDFAINRGLTIQEAQQTLTSGHAKFTLAPQSAAVLTERRLAAPLNWPLTI